MKRLFVFTICFIPQFIFAQPNYLVDSIVVKQSNDTVYVWDYNAWEQCAFQLDYTVETIDSIITITQIDTAADMTTCYGYHNFAIPITGLTEGNYRVDIYRDCLYEDTRFIKSFRFEYIINSIENMNELPDQFTLGNAYPNPFNPSTTISYTIATSPLDPSPYQGEGQRERLVTLKVYDILGREVVTLVDEYKPPGKYSMNFNVETRRGESLPSGVYFYTLMIRDTSRRLVFKETKKMILLK